MTVQLKAITALSYIAITFVFAILWHLIFFRSFYDRIGYFGEEEPVIALGLLTIITQGLLVAYAYPYLQRKESALKDAVRVSLVFGVNTASVQVLAAAAKHHAPVSLEWFLFEGLYFFTQFVLIALAFWLIHTSKRPKHDG